MQIELENASSIAPRNQISNGRHSRPGSGAFQLPALDQAREYLAKVLPWPQDGEAPAYINIHYTVQGPGYGKPSWRGKPCRSVEEAINQLDRLLKQSDVRDIYACMSSQCEVQEKVSAKGKKFAVAVRSQENAVALKSLFLDIDAKGKDKNSYASITEAVGELHRFLNATSLPKPNVIVRSGGGLHAYWAISRALTPDKWKPLALALVEATKRHGLKCDTMVTTDCARVLRIPDTFNRKTNPPRPVKLGGGRTGPDYSVEQLEQALAAYKVAIPSRLKPTSTIILDPAVFPPKSPIPPTELSAGIAANLEEIRSAVMSIPQRELAAEGDWMSIARALAHTAYRYPALAERLWAILDETSRRTEGYNENDNRRRWERYIEEAGNRANPIRSQRYSPEPNRLGGKGGARRRRLLRNGTRAAAPKLTPVAERKIRQAAREPMATRGLRRVT